jgi:hypothetical protein
LVFLLPLLQDFAAKPRSLLLVAGCWWWWSFAFAGLCFQRWVPVFASLGFLQSLMCADILQDVNIWLFLCSQFTTHFWFDEYNCNCATTNYETKPNDSVRIYLILICLQAWWKTVLYLLIEFLVLMLVWFIDILFDIIFIPHIKHIHPTQRATHSAYWRSYWQWSHIMMRDVMNHFPHWSLQY